jgi:hypothetical protein
MANGDPIRVPVITPFSPAANRADLKIAHRTVERLVQQQALNL